MTDLTANYKIVANQFPNLAREYRTRADNHLADYLRYNELQGIWERITDDPQNVLIRGTSNANAEAMKWQAEKSLENHYVYHAVANRLEADAKE